jgi:hypothetical protein
LRTAYPSQPYPLLERFSRGHFSLGGTLQREQAFIES